MISICRKLSRGWNNFELMVSICRKLSRGRDQKKKVPAQLFQPPTNCNPYKKHRQFGNRPANIDLLILLMWLEKHASKHASCDVFKHASFAS